jgi:DNA-binding CsgD family transcriptional regulator
MSAVRDLQPDDVLSLYSCVTLDDFIAQAFRLLPQIVRCDHVSAFYQRSGDGFLKERDSRGHVWTRAFMRRYIELTPAIPFVMAHPGIKVLPTRLGVTASEAELRSTAFYCEVMQPQGWRHGVALCFWSSPVGTFPIFVCTVYRADGRPDFTGAEVAVLESLHPFLAGAVSRFHDISASAAISDGVARALQQVSPGVVVLDWDLSVVRTTAAGRRSCAQWNRTAQQQPGDVRPTPRSVPACLLWACHELRQELSTVSRRGGNPRAHRHRYVAHPDSPALLASVSLVSLDTALADPSFVVTFERPKRSRGSVATTAALAQLTRSESEVALAIVEGCSNQEAADRLGKSVHAVKFLLHRAYQKLGVPNRTSLSLLLRGDA